MKKQAILFIFLVLSGIGLKAQQVVEVWPHKVPGENGSKQEMVLDTEAEPGTVRVTEVTNPTLTEFLPQGNKNNNMAVIVCPGGGYSILAFDKEGTEVSEWLSGQGFTAFTLAYRVPQKEEGALQDLQRAIRLVRSRYPQIEQVGVIGFSAGASLSARAATRYSEVIYPQQDEADLLSCRPDFALLVYPAYLDKGDKRSLTPELTLSATTPPMFIFGTADDFFGNSALVMAQALRDSKIPVELHLMPTGGHGYGMRQGAGLKWPPLAEKWLKEVVRK